MLFHLFHEYVLEKDQSAAHPPCQDTTWATHSLGTLGPWVSWWFRCCALYLPAFGPCLHVIILCIYILYIYTYICILYIQFDVWLFEVFACKCRYRYSIHGESGLFSHSHICFFYHPWMSQCRTSWLMFHPFDHVPSFSMTGWWFQTFVIFHFLYGMSSFPLTNSIMVQDGYCTTNQMMLHQFLLPWCPFSGLQNNTRLNTWSPGCSGKHQCCDVSSPRS